MEVNLRWTSISYLSVLGIFSMHLFTQGVNRFTELPTVTKNSYLLRKSEGNTKIRKCLPKVRIHEKYRLLTLACSNSTMFAATEFYVKANKIRSSERLARQRAYLAAACDMTKGDFTADQPGRPGAVMCERPPELKIVESRSGTSKDHFGVTNAWILTQNGGKSAKEDQEMFTEVL